MFSGIVFPNVRLIRRLSPSVLLRHSNPDPERSLVVKYEPKSRLQSSQIAPTEITLADLYLAVLNMLSLGKTRRRDLLSAIVRIGRIAGRELSQIPLNPCRLKMILEQGSPGTEALSRKSLQNLRSDLAAAIAVSGLSKFLPDRQAGFDARVEGRP
jgi:hypothetical protein